MPCPPLFGRVHPAALPALLALWMQAAAAPARAQAPTPPDPPPAEASGPLLSPAAFASVITVHRGDQLYSLFGHNAIRLADPAIGLDVLYNYGTFDFDTPGFALKFATGRLDYMLSREPFDAAMLHYRQLERTVVEQRLNLTRAEVERLLVSLERNLEPGRRSYRYAFLTDNCSTRVRDMLEAVLGPGLTWPSPPAPGPSYRAMLHDYLAGRPGLRLGIDLLLGPAAEARPTVRGAMFLPAPMADILAGATLTRPGADGRRALAQPRVVLSDSGRSVTPEPGFNYPMLAALGVLGAAAALGARRRGGRPGLGRLRAGFDALLLGVVGLTGLVLAAMWVGSDHGIVRPNWNLAWAWPTHAVAAALVLAGAAGVRGGRWLTGSWRAYLLVSAAAAAATAGAWFALPQRLPIEALPLALAVAVRCAARGWRGARGGTPAA